jgi:glycosyltransferase involved in cell wall biosynthesis
MLDLPEAYVLYHGSPHERVLRDLLSAWSWIADPLGESYPLLAIGLGEAGRDRLASLADEYGLGDTVRSLPGLPPQALGVIYRRSAALLHPLMDPPWGGPVRLALASGVPVVSFESEPMSALVGPAAYLVKAGDTRLLGAALITVLVEEGVSQKLAQAGRQRAGTWSPSAFADGLAQAYESILKKIRRNHNSSRA